MTKRSKKVVLSLPNLYGHLRRTSISLQLGQNNYKTKRKEEVGRQRKKVVLDRRRKKMIKEVRRKQKEKPTRIGMRISSYAICFNISLT